MSSSPLPASFLATLKSFGLNFHHTSNQTISPCFASYLARISLLQHSDSPDFRSFLTTGEWNKDTEINLLRGVLELLQGKGNASVEVETLKLQVKYELKYSQLKERERLNREERAKAKANELESLMTGKGELDNTNHSVNGGNLVHSQAVYTFYREYFQYLLKYSQPESLNMNQRVSRSVHREIAAALESVFPQAALSSYNLLDSAGKRDELLRISDIVFGIRLFNQSIQRGGEDIDRLKDKVLTGYHECITQVNQEIGKLTPLIHTIHDLMQLEIDTPGTISVPLKGLKIHLQALRQVNLLLSQVQFELLQWQDNGNENKNGDEKTSAGIDLSPLYPSEELHPTPLTHWNTYYNDCLNQLKTSISLRTALPKSEVYPKFQQLSLLYHRFYQFQRWLSVRYQLYTLLKGYIQGILPLLQDFIRVDDLGALKSWKEEREKNGQWKEKEKEMMDTMGEWVETLVETENENENKSAETEASSNVFRPVRLTVHSSPRFLSYPLEYQGYCPYSLLIHDGYLTPGNPNYGLIRFGTHYYAFSSPQAMKEFVQDPERFIDGIRRLIPRYPVLLYLLGIQHQIPCSDIVQLMGPVDLGLSLSLAAFAQAGSGSTGGDLRAAGEEDGDGDAADGISSRMAALGLGSTSGSSVDRSGASSSKGFKKKRDVEIQCGDEDIPDSREVEGEWKDYHWNEWELRRRAIQMADIANRSTHSTQTHESHFRRENSTQYSLQKRQLDGTMPGKGTQTKVEKSTNSERQVRYMAGLRGKSNYSKEISNGKVVASKEELQAVEGPNFDGLMKVIKYVTPPVVQDHTNPDLRKMKF